MHVAKQGLSLYYQCCFLQSCHGCREEVVKSLVLPRQLICLGCHVQSLNWGILVNQQSKLPHTTKKDTQSTFCKQPCSLHPLYILILQLPLLNVAHSCCPSLHNRCMYSDCPSWLSLITVVTQAHLLAGYITYCPPSQQVYTRLEVMKVELSQM